MPLLSDRELLARILELDEREGGVLCSNEQRVFVSMRAQEFPLTQKQVDWIRSVGERLELQVAPARNTFSSLTAEKRAEQAKQAERVKLPWEQPGYVKAAKPPGVR